MKELIKELEQLCIDKKVSLDNNPIMNMIFIEYADNGFTEGISLIGLDTSIQLQAAIDKVKSL